MKLDDVVAHSGNDLKIVDGDGFAEIYKFIVVSCSFAHLLHFEERVFCCEEGFEMEKQHQIVVLLAIGGDLLFDWFLVVLDSVEIFLPELEDIVCAGGFVEAADYAVGQEIAETILIFEALADEEEGADRFLLLLLLFLVGEGLQGAIVAVVIDLLGELELHVIEVDSGWMFVVVERGDGQGRNWQNVRHSLWKLHILML